ncbi:haspin like kinase domain-containing protein [Sarocladium implicatum]|nr:haspin like kinase domain-containing protein [Sarocladium implicatum]
MSKTTRARTYGKSSKRSKAQRLFVELAQSPIRPPPTTTLHDEDDPVSFLSEKLGSVQIIEEKPETSKPRRSPRKSKVATQIFHEDEVPEQVAKPAESKPAEQPAPLPPPPASQQSADALPNELVEADGETSLRILAWDDVCPPGDRIEKIAEASSAEVYRVTNDRGTSIIKVIRLPSPIKPLTKAQIKARLIDEEPQSADDIRGELEISEWLADIPGFVVYKERYVVRGKGTKELLDTHQKFQRRLKRRDPGRAQFYPSPSRYLDETEFLVVELGDAGTALEDWVLDSVDQVWDILFLEAIALARAEDMFMFEHRDLHEGNLCLKKRSAAKIKPKGSRNHFGHSGLDITILDFGLSRAEDLSKDDTLPVAYDLERCLDLFTSTYASQCKVYRQMRSFLLRADRQCLPPSRHTTPYESGIDGPISWDTYAPYTNVLWLAYLYIYLLENFKGPKKELEEFKEETRELWKYLNPEADEEVPAFGSAAEIVHFAVESGWVREEQLMDGSMSMMEREDSIIVARHHEEGELGGR